MLLQELGLLRAQVGAIFVDPDAFLDGDFGGGEQAGGDFGVGGEFVVGDDFGGGDTVEEGLGGGVAGYLLVGLEGGGYRCGGAGAGAGGRGGG